MTTFAALGDSITLGIGDPAGRSGGRRGWRGWAALLADGLPDPRLHILATSGARMADVEQDQLPAALALRPDLASLVIGINDTLRADFSLDAFAAAATRTVGSLHAAGATVLTMRLPDPGQMLGIPGVLARPLARRAREINAVMDGLHARHGTVHFDAARDPQTYDRQMWAADRLHPSERGHRLLAHRFALALRDAGHPVPALPGLAATNPEPTVGRRVWWMATQGNRWLLRRSTDLFPALLESMAGSDATCIKQMAQELSAEHRALDTHWRRVRAALDAIVGGAKVDVPSAAVEALASLCERHTAFEDAELLPMADRLLSDPELLRLMDAMAERRERL